MDRILEKLVEAEGGEAVVENPGAGGGDLNLTSDDMNDVMKVLTGFDDYADAVDDGGDHGESKAIEESFTSVQDMAKVVDKVSLANERFLELNHRQEEQAVFAEMLERLARGIKTEEDLELLRSRVFPIEDPQIPKDTLYIF